jgi:hypothetical protein
MLAATTALGQPRGAAAGAFLAGVIAVAAAQMRPAEEDWRPAHAESVSTA